MITTIVLCALELVLLVLVWQHAHWSVAATLTWYLLRRLAEGICEVDWVKAKIEAEEIRKRIKQRPKGSEKVAG